MFDLYYNKYLNVPSLKADPNGVISPQYLCEYINSIIQVVEADIKKHVNKYPIYYWKFMISALPKDAYKGGIQTTWLFTIQMLESCISFSNNEIISDELYKDGFCVLIDITEDMISDYGELIGLTKVLRDLYVLLRFSSKGCYFIVDLIENDIFPINDNNIIESIELYDTRNIGESVISGDFNIPSRCGFSLNQNKNFSAMTTIILTTDNKNPKYETVYKRLKGNGAKETVRTNYHLSTLNLETIINEFDCSKEISPWEMELLEISCIFSFTTYAMLKGWVLITDIITKGYMLMPKEFTHAHFRGFMKLFKNKNSKNFRFTTNIKPEEILNKYLHPIENNIYPSNSSMIFDAGNMIGFNLSTATGIFVKLSEYTKKQGNIANLRGKFFEEQTQELIDKTEFTPNEKIKALISRDLRFNNKKITDLDAIMIVDNVLLILSCKSILLTDDYDKGNYNAIRNTTKSIEKYVSDWREKVAFFNENPVGGNYDLSSFKEISGIVVTPNVLYLDQQYRQELPIKGLFEQMSLLELEKWMKYN